MFRQFSRNFDPTGLALSNLIVSEERELALTGKYLFVPSHGPFYTASLVITDGKKPLTTEQYRLHFLHQAATYDSAKEVFVAIEILDRSLTKAYVTYQAVGGKYQNLVEVLRQVATNAINGGNDIPFENIIDKPEKFYPSSHWQPHWEFKGWEKWVEPLTRVLNALAHHDRYKYKEVYDYYHAKIKAIENFYDSKLQTIEDKAIKELEAMEWPEGVLFFFTLKRNNQIDQGTWEKMAIDTVFKGVLDDKEIGKTWTLSKDPVPPIPENLLLDEDYNPIMFWNQEWCFLDNEHEAKSTSGGDDYWKEVEEQYDTLGVQVFKKTAKSPIMDLRATVNATTVLLEDQTSTFSAVTTGYPKDTVINYSISGLYAENSSVPLTGTIKTDDLGIAKLDVKLIKGSPATGKSVMTVVFGLENRLADVSRNYKLINNELETTVSKISRYRYGARVSNMDEGDTYILDIRHTAMNGKSLTLTLTGLPTNSIVTVAGKEYKGNVIQLPIPAGIENTTSFAISIRSKDSFKLTNVGFKIATPSKNEEKFNMKLIPYEILDAYFVTKDISKPVTEISADEVFSVFAKHSSADNMFVNIAVTGNNSGVSITPASIPQIYMKYNGQGTSNPLRFVTASAVVNQSTITVELKPTFDKPSAVKTITLKVNPKGEE